MNDKKSFTKANERLLNHFLCHTETCTSIRQDYLEEGLGSQTAAVGRLRSRFSCSQNRAKMGTAPQAPPCHLPSHTMTWAASSTVKSLIISNSNCMQSQKYFPVTVSLVRLCTSSAQHIAQKAYSDREQSL